MTKTIYNQLLDAACKFDGSIYMRADLHERGEKKAAAKMAEEIIDAACDMRCVIETILKEYEYVNYPKQMFKEPF